jgi:hypothetical protein
VAALSKRNGITTLCRKGGLSLRGHLFGIAQTRPKPYRQALMSSACISRKRSTLSHSHVKAKCAEMVDELGCVNSRVLEKLGLFSA